jgi:hypothetical protein
MGIGAVRGLETCTAAASGWTNKWMLQVTGERGYAEQMERAIFNAGAAAVSRDFDTACYFQTMNRIDGVVPVHTIENIEGYDYSKTAGPTLCCVANATRMIPDYVQHMWMATLDGGLAATLYGPSRVETIVDDGTAVAIDANTAYPFTQDIVLTVSPAQPISFPLHVRIPTWCERPSVKVNGTPVTPDPGSRGFLKIERKWAEGDEVRLEFPMTAKVEVGATTAVPDTEYYRKPNRATPITTVKNAGYPYASVHYGPLLFALPIADETPNKAQAGARWQYALTVEAGPAATQPEVVRSEMPRPFQWQLDSPLKLRVPAVRFDWQPTNTKPLPDGPVDGGEAETITLVPYGCTKFRVSMFPTSRRAH